ncbi:hypothetical protein VE03_04393 [Pseudogymnoascus sp. 23342-1-I1]|nr:hypothetical protein VE03_04393 [Pseudogymnoascus sp. 23342-1-I1]
MDDAVAAAAAPPNPSPPPPSTHRLPTLTAAQALAAQRAEEDVRMGVLGLDGLLGVRRGEVTEIYGAPGVGKRAFGLQFAVAALKRGEGVVWVDASNPLPGPRLEAVLSASLATSTSEPPSQPPHPSPAEPPTPSTLLKNLTTFTPPTFPHLLALLSSPLPSKTTLLILSSPSSLLPPTPTTPPRQKPTSNPITPLINALRRLAATSHIALLVLSQTVTQLQPHGPAALVPAIGGAAWEGGVAGRVVLWREWGGRYVRVVRRGGRGVEGVVGGFVVTENGVEDAPVVESEREIGGGRKRKADEVLEGGMRLGDDDYGWDEGDEVGMPLLGPQTQGSEDVLVVPGEDTETEEEEGWGGGEEGEGSGGETPRDGAGDGDAHDEDARAGLPLSPYVDY